MARLSTIFSVGMLIMIVCQTSAQTLDERLQQFASSFVRITLLFTFRFILIRNLVFPDAIQKSHRD